MWGGVGLCAMCDRTVGPVTGPRVDELGVLGRYRGLGAGVIRDILTKLLLTSKYDLGTRLKYTMQWYGSRK